MALFLQFQDQPNEAGIDEAGRGCLAGPVVAAAVILAPDTQISGLNDSKKLSHAQRMKLRPQIIEQAIAWQVAMIHAPRIDEINILHATYEAMHAAVSGLSIPPTFLAIDGNRFRPFSGIPHACIIKGDGKFLNIAAASVLAKTFRDDFMEKISAEYPQYSWNDNKGYPTKAHKEAIRDYGLTPWHRKTFNWTLPLTLF